MKVPILVAMGVGTNWLEAALGRRSVCVRVAVENRYPYQYASVAGAECAVWRNQRRLNP
jgi:hypothetical protein